MRYVLSKHSLIQIFQHFQQQQQIRNECIKGGKKTQHTFKLSKGYEILRKRTIELVLSNTSNNNEVDETSTSRFLYRVIDVLFAMALDTKSKKQSLVISNRDAVDMILSLACSCTPSSCSEGRARISRVCMTALQDMLSLSAANLVHLWSFSRKNLNLKKTKPMQGKDLIKEEKLHVI